MVVMSMHRREFLKSAAVFSVAAMNMTADTTGFIPAPGPWREFVLTTRIEILKPQGTVRAWIPIPVLQSDDWIHPLDNSSKVEGGKASTQAGAVCIEWPATSTAFVAEAYSRVRTRDRLVDVSTPAAPRPLADPDRQRFTTPTKLIVTDGLVAETAGKITAGARDDLSKAQRIYEWIIANTSRDPKVRGCGIGDISSMLKTGNLSGKCADLNSLFVGLARAAGLPARDLFGIRVAPSRFGYKSLGANSETVTKAQHCRAEVYLSRLGWVPADPADVRKVMLEEPPGNLALDDPKVGAAHRTLFGAWEGNWIAFNDVHDVALPGATEAPLGFFMYPQAETSAGRLDCLDPDQFKYTITAKEVG